MPKQTAKTKSKAKPKKVAVVPSPKQSNALTVSKAISTKPAKRSRASRVAAEAKAEYTEPTPPRPTEVKITAAKGRPMLTWVGKRPLRQVIAFPAQLVETFDPASQSEKREGLLFHGDNKEVLAYLLANGYRGKVNLIYIDPPFDSGADYVRKVQLRGIAGVAKLNGEEYTLGEQIQYTDIWANDNYLQFMYERLLLLKELLAEDGSIYLHTDWHKGHFLRCLMDEVFGSENYLNEIVWYFPNKIQGNVKRFATNHNTLLYYAKNKSNYTFNRIEEERDKTIKVNARYWDGQKSVFATRRDEKGKVVYVERSERVIDDMWTIAAVSSSESKQEDYPTQKPDELLERILIASSKPNDLVLDCFVGSGTTAVIAQKLGLRWIGCDINNGAIQTTSKRLQTIIREQIEQEQERAKQEPMPQVEQEDADEPRPAQLAFSVYRVNDYDLQIQHNEAMNLAIEHVGIKRTKTDPFFEGELGKQLVKIIPFNHPLTPLDLEQVKNELANRPDEERDIKVVCLGQEVAVDAWLTEWNRYRKQRDVANKIEIIELRTDPKYGKFFEHKSASARVEIKHTKDKIKVTLNDFLSPTIIERLQQQAGILTPQITDWRAMVDSVMIDTAYDGQVFNIAFADIPEKKSDLVSGEYELDAPEGKTTVAVKIVDMLGEEVLETKEV